MTDQIEPDWIAIGNHLSREIGRPFFIADYAPASGGSIHQAFRISDGSDSYFVKLCARKDRALLEAEAEGLEIISSADAVRTPELICLGETDEQVFLAMEYLNLTGEPREKVLAEQLVCLHQVTARQHGLPSDNFIGRSAQSNKHYRHWPEFFLICRLLPQLDLAFRNGFERQLGGVSDRLIQKLPAWFDDHSPKPSLVHGDLWSGNVDYLIGGDPVIYDPAVYYGDRETDIAMTRLFGWFSEEFYATYQALWPMPEGYERRARLYNLYHLLNHLNLFGSGYLDRCVRTIQYLAE